MVRWISALRVAVRSIIRRGRVEDELNEELNYHLEEQIREGRKAGLTPEAARSAALRAMGPIELNKEACRDLRRGNRIGELLSDLRYAGRTMRRTPGFSLLAIAIMALGIGANTAVFSVVSGVLLKPLPYPGADRIVSLRSTNVKTGQANPLVTLANFRDWRDQSFAFEAMATYRSGEAPITPGDTAEFARHANVDARLFRVFSVEPVLGRTFTADEESAEPSQLAAIISHGYWQTRYGGDPEILHRTIRVGSGVRTIVGVMPAGFQFPNRTDVWTPQPQTTGPPSRTSHNLGAVARLEPNVSLAAAQTELNTIASRLEQQYPASNQGRGVSAIELQEVLVGNVRLTLYLLWGVVGVVLLIACANTATLLLGQAMARTRELAVRSALGASRSRVIRQLITESVLLAIVAGGAGLALAYVGVRLLVALTPADIVRLTDTGLDTTVLAFTMVISIATGALFGLMPALHASRIELADAMKVGGSRAVVGGQTTRTRGLLVVSEVALAVVLLTGAGLLMKSLIALNNVDLGFQPENVLVMKATGVRPRAENNAFFGSVIPRIAALPGVIAVGATSIPPGDLSNSGDGAYFIDRVPEERDRSRDPAALFTITTPGAFAALGIPLKSGRDFNEGDTEDRPLVAIVNEALVRESLGGQDPIGRTIFCSWDTKDGMTIVGVVGDARQRSPALKPMPDCYMPYLQHAYNNNTLNVVIRTDGDPMAMAGTVRRVAAEIAPEVPVSFTTADATLAKRMEEPRFRALLIAVFAVLAVCLAMAGVYGVMAHAIGLRSKEIALRMALGASRGSVMRQVLRQTLMLTALGLGLGLAASVAASRLLTTMLFEVRPVDAQVYAGVAILLGVVALLAGFLPGRRAATVDPVEVLKAD